MAKDTDYARLDLFVPKATHELKDSIVGLQPGKACGRQIDLWWAALMIGVRRQRRTPFPTSSREDRVKFNDGAILTTDDWRIPQMELIALAEGGTAAVESAQAVVEICQEYANTGLELIADELRGESVPVVTFMRRLPALLGIQD